MHIEDFLKQENVNFPLADMWVNRDRQRLSSLCYLDRKGELLLIKRNKEPFSGFWTAPGGKLEPGEDPRQAIIREIREETGLTIINPRLQMITSETGVDPNYNWLLFVFRCTEFCGNLQECNEGILRWVPQQQIADLQIPDVDRKLLPFISDSSQRYFVRLSYDDKHQVAMLQKVLI